MKGLEALLNPDQHMTEEDRADQAGQMHSSLALLHHQQGRKADTGLASNGICDDCGNKIPPGRIAALPHCIRCIDCQQAFELRGRR